MLINRSLINTMTETDVAYEIEDLANEIFNCDFHGSSCLFNHELIQTYYFIDSMNLLLYVKHIKGDKVGDFIEKYSNLKRIRMSEITNFKDIFTEFLDIFEEGDESIHYHIIAEDKNYHSYYKKNILDVGTINDIVDKYKSGIDFNIEGKVFNKSNINSLRVVTTDGFPKVIADKLNESQKGKPSYFHFTEENIISGNIFTIDVTDKFFF